jgi:HSP20 family molecular chaperone IbpA
MDEERDVKRFFAELSKITGDRPDDASSVHTRVRSSDDELRGADAEDLGDERDGQLAVDVYQKGSSLIVEAPIAGVNSDDLDIHITAECYWGRFSRSVMLPEEIDADRAEATIKNGVLRITMPRLHGEKGKKVRIQE